MKALSAAGLLALACGSDDGSKSGTQSNPGCTKAPLSCPSGTTCWPVDTQGNYDCVAAPTDKLEGAACMITLGQAQCAPGHFCYPIPGTSNGTCSPFCGADNTCANSAQCVSVFVQNTPSQYLVPVCTPSGTGGTAGTAGTGGSAGSSGSAGTGGSAGAAAAGGSAGAAAAGGVAGAADAGS